MTLIENKQFNLTESYSRGKYFLLYLPLVIALFYVRVHQHTLFFHLTRCKLDLNTSAIMIQGSIKDSLCLLII